MNKRIDPWETRKQEAEEDARIAREIERAFEEFLRTRPHLAEDRINWIGVVGFLAFWTLVIGFYVVINL